MQIQKLKLAAYAMAKRCQGYQLLRNPKNASPLSLTMLKSKACPLLTLGIVDYYSRITKDFSKPGKAMEEIVYSYKYYPQKEGDKFQKHVSYLKMQPYVSKEKGTMPENRPCVPNRTYEMRDKIDSHRYYSLFSNRLTRILFDPFGIDSEKTLRPNFFTVLFNNLKAK